MKFQYYSDIHLEFYNENINKIHRLFDKKTNADVLLLAGDIGYPNRKSYKHFIDMVSPKYKHVFVISGNHEYYKQHPSSMQDVDAMCRDICNQAPHGNVRFLQNEAHQISEDISIYGGTAWTCIPRSKFRSVEASVRDYELIHDFTPHVSNMLHQNFITGLESTLENTSEKMKWIVMSHHIPSHDLVDPKYKVKKYEDINVAFASDVHISHDPRIVAWVYGHTHSPLQKEKFYCNPIGYPGENQTWTLEKEFTIIS